MNSSDAKDLFLNRLAIGTFSFLAIAALIWSVPHPGTIGPYRDVFWTSVGASFLGAGVGYFIGFVWGFLRGLGSMIRDRD